MNSLLHVPTPVHLVSIVGLPERDDGDRWTTTEDDRWTIGPETETESETEPFHPSLLEEAEDLGYRCGLEDGRPCSPPGWPAGARIRYAMGRRRGARAREEREAFDLGEAMGYSTGISEPPAGFGDREKAAYRRGFESALADLEATDARLERMEVERMEDAFGGPEDRVHHAELIECGFFSGRP